MQASADKAKMWIGKLSCFVQLIFILSLFQVPAFAIKKVIPPYNNNSKSTLTTNTNYIYLFCCLAAAALHSLSKTNLCFVIIYIDKSYIVYLGSHAHGPQVSEADLHRVTDSHAEFLGSFLGRY